MTFKYKKRKLSRVLADAVLSCHCTGDLKLALEHAISSHEQDAINNYSFYVENLSEDLNRMIAEHIIERLKTIQ